MIKSVDKEVISANKPLVGGDVPNSTEKLSITGNTTRWGVKLPNWEVTHTSILDDGLASTIDPIEIGVI